MCKAGVDFLKIISPTWQLPPFSVTAPTHSTGSEGLRAEPLLEKPSFLAILGFPVQHFDTKSGGFVSGFQKGWK